MAEPPTNFYEQFGDRLAALFADVPGNREAIHALLWEIVQSIGNKICLNSRHQKRLHRDAFSEVWMHAVSLIPKAGGSRKISAWYRKAIYCEFLRICRRGSDCRVTGIGLNGGDALDAVGGGAAYCARISDYEPTLRNVRNKKRRFAGDQCGAMPEKMANQFRRYFNDRVDRAAGAFAAAETDGERVRADAYLQAIQEDRRFVFRQYRPCETDLVRYTVDRRIEKEQL